MKLTIVPFESVASDSLPRDIARRLKSILPWRFSVAHAQPDPLPAHGDRALDVAHVLSLLPQSSRHDEVAMALIGLDLVVPGLSYVFGYAAPEKHVAVVSLHRLANGTHARRGGRRLLVERACKEMLHEAGHLMGLAHCEHAGCVMQYSQTLHDTDIKDCCFCADCLRELSRLPEPVVERGGTDSGL